MQAPPHSRANHPETAAVLLEVVLALALFVGSAAVIGTGLSRSADEAARLRASAHALDLAASTLSELQMGLRPLKSADPEPFPPPFDQFTCQIEIEPSEPGSIEAPNLPLLRARITVRCDNPFTFQRLEQIIPAVENAPEQSPGLSQPDESSPAPGEP